MKISRAVVALSWLVAVLALLAASAGLFWQGGGAEAGSTFTTLRGAAVQPYGRGLYRFDSVFKGAGNRGTDAATLVVAIPLLVVSTLRYRRGSVRGGLLLTGTLAYFLYLYASLALSTAYNEAFLIYVALFSASFFAFVPSFAYARPVASRFSDRLPRRAIAAFMLASGSVTAVVWLAPLLASIARGEPPELLESYTTMVTEVLDLGVIVPATLVSGALLLRRDPLGYLVALPLLVLIVLLGPGITAATVSQASAGVSFTTAQIVGPITGFLVLGLVAVGILVLLLRDV